MVGMIQQKTLENDPSGETLYEFRRQRHYIDELNELTSPEHLPKVAKALVDSLKKANPEDWEKPIEVLIDGQIRDNSDLPEKLLGFLRNLGPDVKEQLIRVFERAEKHPDWHVGVLFGLCYDEDMKVGFQVSIPNVFQSGRIPVMITAGPAYLTVVKP
jgi:hypothetical protein